MKSSLLFTTFASVLCFFGQAQTMPDSHIKEKAASTKIIYIDGKPESETVRRHDLDSIRNVVSMYYYDQFRHFMDPDSPYFLFMSKDSQMSMGIGGGVRMRAYYDWGGAVPSSAFAPITIPIPANPASMRHFATVPSGTYLFFRVIGRCSPLGEYQLYIESDFTGYQGRDFKLKKAYATVGDFTFGYASSTFSDPMALPPVVDAAGPNNKFSATSVLARYMPQFKQHWYAGVSVETPSTMVAADNVNTRPVSEWLPDAAAMLQYEWQRGQHVRLSGIVRSLSYRDMVAERNHNLAGWGMQLSSVARPHNRVTTYLTANYGYGYAGLGSDLLYGAYDLIVDPENPAKLYAPASYGWCAGVQYNFKPNLFATVSASQTRFLPKDGVSPEEYKYGVFACANVFWSILPRVTVAAELDYGFRRNFSGTGRSAHRANVMASFTF
ncbi:MAG: hypothetical protein K2O00_07420 [Muribaculaceae bacterium]|nr:hypothetical protein [Muribaculaceae bacterium]